MIAYEKIARPTYMGGLGMRRTKINNIAFLLKTTWSLCDNQGQLWHDLLKSKYFKNSDSWKSSSNVMASPFWAAIKEVLHWLYEGSFWLLGNGCKLNLWRDERIKGVPQPIPPQRINALEPTMVHDLLQEDGGWNEDLVKKIFIPDVTEKIINMQTQYVEHDVLIWAHHPKGIFSSSSAYHTISNYMIYYKKIIGMDIHGCLYCDHTTDSLQHLFFGCPHARAIWFAAGFLNTWQEDGWLKQIYGIFPKHEEHNEVDYGYSTSCNLYGRLVVNWSMIKNC